MGSCLSADSRSPNPDGAPSGVRKKKNSRKRFASRSSFDSKKDDYLLRIPGRLSFNGSTHFASLFTQQGRKGTNQDAMLVWENFCSRTDTIFCGVFDGHGPYGHLVAKGVRDSLPQKLDAQWEVSCKNEVFRETGRNSSMTSEDCSVDEESRVFFDVGDSEKQPDIFETLRESFLKAYKIMDRDLRLRKTVDCFCSGTTAVTLIKQGQDLVIGNVGDSRAVLGTREEDNTLAAVQLTVDLKPNLPAEAERIKKCRGRVFSLRDEPDVSRVWLPNNDSPGLAMARAFGDFCLKDFGLIAVPEVSYRRLTEKDEFIVLATDGIWDVLSNKEVVNIVASAPSRSAAAQALVETAVQGWKIKYPTSKIDDCAVVCLFLGTNTDSSSFSNNQEKDQASEQSHLRSVEEDVDESTGLIRSGTVRMDDGIPADTSNEEEYAYEEEMLEEGDYSALEGVTRVNTLLNLPRFTPEKKG